MTTNTEDKMLKLLETLVEGQEQTNKRLDSLTKEVQDVKQSQAHLTTAVEALAEGQKEDTQDLKVEIVNLRAEVLKKTRNHETRLKNVEKHTGTTDPTKN